MTMSENWYYTKDGKNKNGPVTAAQLGELARSGQILPTDMVKRDDMQKWLPASQVKGIFADNENPAPRPPPIPQSVADTSNQSAESVGTTKTRNPPITENPVLIGVALLFCFPAGMFFLWTHPKWTKNQKYAWGGAFAGFCLFCLLISIMSQRATQKNLAEADKLWEAGQKAEAVAKYKSVLDGGVSSIDRSQRPTILQRVIEFEADQGNTSAAKAMIQKAMEFDVSLAFNTPTAKNLLAEVQAEKERAGREKQAEKEREAKVAQAKSSSESGSRSGWDGTADKGGDELPESITLADGSRCLTQNALLHEKAFALLQPKMTPERVKAILGEPNGKMTDDKGNLFWAYKAATPVVVVFGSQGEWSNRFSILEIDGKWMFVTDQDFRSKGGMKVKK